MTQSFIQKGRYLLSSTEKASGSWVQVTYGDKTELKLKRVSGCLTPDSTSEAFSKILQLTEWKTLTWSLHF